MFDFADLPRPVVRHAVGLWRRRWTLMACAWAAALVGWGALWLLPDKYESRAQVFVQTETILEPVMSGVTASPDYQSRVNVMRQQLLTRPNVEEIVYRAGLDKTIEARSDLERRVKMERLVDWVASEIDIDSPQAMYFTISYRFGDPAVARNVVDAVLNLLIEQDLGASLEEREEARRLLDQQIESYGARLTAKEQEIAAFRRAHGDELSASEGVQRQREQMRADLARVGDDLSREQQRVATLRSLLAATPRASTGDELDNLKIQLAQLRSQYNENYPDIQNLKARIDQLENAGVGALPGNPEYRRLETELTAAEGQVAALRARESRLRADLETFAYSISRAPGAEADLQRILRDYEQMQKSYDELLQRGERLALTTSLGAGGQGVEYRIFERPTASLSPVSPPRLLLIAAVLALALGVGTGIAILLTHLQKTYTQSADLKESFGLPVLGSISEAPSPQGRRTRRLDLARLGAAGAGLALAALAYAYLEVWRLPADTGVVETAGLAGIGARP